MKIGIQTWGSDGDILPLMALAEGLKEAGHEVTVAYTSVDNKDYSAYALRGGFSAFRAYDQFKVGIDEAMDDIVRTNDPLKQFMLVVKHFYNPALEAMYQASLRLCAENDIVIGHMMSHTLLTAADKTGCPRVSVALAPMAIRTKEVPLFGPNLGPLLNSLTWMLGDYIGKKKLFQPAEEIRRREGLPPIKSMQKELYISRDLTLVACSQVLTLRREEWGDNIQICGDLTYSESDNPIPIPEGLDDFLSLGEAPVYITFGSLTPYESERMDRLIIEAVEMSGCRAIIQSSAQGKVSSKIFRCYRAPHASVFPRCAAIVHHGGAGTTHSALRAGCPSIVVEHAFDQLFWATELHRVGVAGKALHRNRLTSEQLADTIRCTLESTEMKKRAESMGQRMRDENGVKNAVALIERKFHILP